MKLGNVLGILGSNVCMRNAEVQILFFFPLFWRTFPIPGLGGMISNISLQITYSVPYALVSSRIEALGLGQGGLFCKFLPVLHLELY